MIKYLIVVMFSSSLLFSHFEIKDIYSVNYDIIVEIENINGEINEEVEKEICNLESIKSVRGDIYIKYKLDKIIRVKKIELSDCFK